MKLYLNKAFGLFFVLCLVFVPFILQATQLAVTSFIFKAPVQWLGQLMFGHLGLKDFSSDTRSLNLLLLWLFVMALVTAAFIKKREVSVITLLKTLVTYFLAFALLKYGLDKVFNLQFYQPGPNILYTPFGNLDKDILFWSTVGISPAYSIITGAVEVLAALLLLFRRTRTIGLLIALVALLHIVIINFSFDISVKTFSLLLTAMAVYLLGQQLQSLYNFLVLQKMSLLPQPPHLNVPMYAKTGLKVFVIGLMLLETLYPQFSTPGPIPELHGAYKVTQYSVNGKVIDSCLAPVKRVFVHKNYYFVLQSPDDSMTDFYFEQNTKNLEMKLRGYDGREHVVNYTKAGDAITFNFLNGVQITVLPLPWISMPALQNQFHLTVDAVGE
jgi:hypothetical protein